MNYLLFSFGFTCGIISTVIGLSIVNYRRHKQSMADREKMHDAFKAFVSSMDEHNEREIERESKEVH